MTFTGQKSWFASQISGLCSAVGVDRHDDSYDPIGTLALSEGFKDDRMLHTVEGVTEVEVQDSLLSA